jgi:acyl-coenzyme A thioesterase PaaI-like protein
MVRRIVESPDNRCFVCGPHNPHGLHLHFDFVDGVVRGTFTTAEWQGGWQGVIHGGVLAALLDEAMAYTLFFNGERGVTARMELRYRAAVHALETIDVTANVVRETSRIADIEAQISRDESVVVQASARFMKLGPLRPDMASPLDLGER